MYVPVTAVKGQNCQPGVRRFFELYNSVPKIIDFGTDGTWETFSSLKEKIGHTWHSSAALISSDDSGWLSTTI